MTMTERNTEWALDREIVLSRVLDAPRELVYRAWTDPKHVTQWFAPKDFTCETVAIDVRVGGLWRFLYLGPNGVKLDKRIEFLEMKAPERIVFDYGSDKDADPGRFRCTITFDAQSDGKTVVTMRQIHPTKEQRDATVGFGAVAIGYTTMDKLAEHLKTMAI
jgi:uncharacterized protein YndB with AHSA1/START domain